MWNEKDNHKKLDENMREEEGREEGEEGNENLERERERDVSICLNLLLKIESHNKTEGNGKQSGNL